MDWRGVFPAITTPFREDLSIDEELLARHVAWQVDSGALGVVALGSLGEGATLERGEKVRVLEVCREAIGGRVPLLAGIAALSTADAQELACAARRAGSDGLMVLPPYVYRGDRRETLAHFGAVLSATDLPCMLYNNPIAYGTDLLPEDIDELASAHANVVAVKESSADVRRVTALRALLGDRYALFVGVDDLIVEGMDAGAVGWVAGLVNAFPDESVRLFDLVENGARESAGKLYDWFLPLLRLDTVPKFVQLIKLVQAEVGWGSPRVRPPRLPLTGAELESARELIRERLTSRLA